MNEGSKLAQVVLRRGGARSSTVGLLAAIALLVGYFLPWTAHSGLIEDGLGVDQRLLARASSAAGGAEQRSLGERLRAGEALSGQAWAELLDAVQDTGDLEPRQEVAVRFAGIGIEVLPYALGGLLVLLLLLGVPPARAMKFGGGPAAGVLYVAQTRFASSLLVVVQLALSLLVFAVADTLWLSARFLGEEESRVGTGLFLMVGGSALSLVAGFLGYGPGRLRALCWALALVMAFAGFAWWSVERAG